MILSNIEPSGVGVDDASLNTTVSAMHKIRIALLVLSDARDEPHGFDTSAELRLVSDESS